MFMTTPKVITMTRDIESEFQKPVRDKLAEIVVPDSQREPWDMPDLLGVNQWYVEAQSFQDEQMREYERAMREIELGTGHGTIKGEFPSPTKRKRKRTKRTVVKGQTQ
jgi:hypothetical protein